MESSTKRLAGNYHFVKFTLPKKALVRDWISRGFAMFLLLVMIILGTITMVNLFVVVIISDLSDLQTEV